jgi:hypothetical protein
VRAAQVGEVAAGRPGAAASACYVLDAVVFDWLEFRRLAEAGRAGRDPAPLRCDMSLLRGQPFTGMYYWWLETALLANLELGVSDLAAGSAAKTGLASDPAAEQLCAHARRTRVRQHRRGAGCLAPVPGASRRHRG